MDDETSLVYMKARFYDPDSSRFLTEDTYLGMQDTPPSLNRYLYAYSNPAKYIDPTGNFVEIYEKLYQAGKRVIEESEKYESFEDEETEEVASEESDEESFSSDAELNVESKDSIDLHSSCENWNVHCQSKVTSQQAINRMRQKADDVLQDQTGFDEIQEQFKDGLLIGAAATVAEKATKGPFKWLLDKSKDALTQAKEKYKKLVGGKNGKTNSNDKNGVTNTADKGKYTNRRNVNYRSADDVNADFDGYKPPYKPGTKVTEYNIINDDQFVRVHGKGKAARSWMMKREAIEGLSPQEISKKYSLPEVPTHISDINVPAGTRMRTGRVANNFGGNNGAIQYQWLGRMPQSAVKNTRLL